MNISTIAKTKNLEMKDILSGLEATYNVIFRAYPFRGFNTRFTAVSCTHRERKV